MERFSGLSVMNHNLLKKKSLVDLVNFLAHSGVNILYWVLITGSSPVIKIAVDNSWFPPSDLNVGGIKFVRWHPGSLSRQLIVGRVGKDLRTNEDLKSLIIEAIENVGLRADGAGVYLMKKYTKV